MIEKETLMLLSTQVEERRKALLEDMGRGAGKYEAYLSATGEIRGYMMVQSMIADATSEIYDTGKKKSFDSTPTDSVVKTWMNNDHRNPRQKNSLHFRRSYYY
jgi:histidine ammonia-lyase